MKNLDWHALQPARPLDGADEHYVERPWGGGDALAGLVRHGLTPLAVTGPIGGGKTTELHRAIEVLVDLVALEVPIDLLVDAKDLRPEVLIFEVAQFMLDKVLEQNPGAVPSRALVEDIRASDPRLSKGGGLNRKPVDLATMVAEEVRKLQKRARVALFLDGLDRMSDAQAKVAVRALLALQHAVELVIVVPPALANGPEAHEVLAHMRVWWVPAVPVATPEGRLYLRKVALARLGLQGVGSKMREVLDEAAVQSGGVTRLFLHLIQDAAFYGAARGKQRPDREAMQAARRDHTDAMRRVLVAGDLEALAAADGTDGLDVPPERKVRLLAHNLLLEFDEQGRHVVRPHPLLLPLIEARR